MGSTVETLVIPEPSPFLRRTSKMSSFRKILGSIINPASESEFLLNSEEPSSTSTPIRRSTRTGSLRRAVNSSIRRTRKIFGIGAAPPEIELPPIILEEFVEGSFHDSCTLSRYSTKKYEVIKGPSDDKIFTRMTPVVPLPHCCLTKLFPKEERPKDRAAKKSRMSSFEKKRRYHQSFGVDHHAKEQLFCPLQASQVEFAFKTQTKSDIVIKVQAPNGECSGYIYPNFFDYTSFTPTNIGCGHGRWLIHVAIRRGCKFHHGFTKHLDLIGQGVLFFEIDMVGRIRETGRLWLDCLN
ncbi:unnamed protein product [Caenorhabditis brenneri]